MLQMATRVARTAVLAVALCCVAAATNAQTAPGADAANRLDLAFALDTTGSMGPWIEQAREAIWSVVDRIAAAEPGTRIRVGLVAYRDREDEYVTRRAALSADVDEIYAELVSLGPAGGGDTPEAVRDALVDAVAGLDWDRTPGARRVLVLVGDAPPHARDAQTPAAVDTASRARERGIAVHTLQCGRNRATETAWRAIAEAGGGTFSRLPDRTHKRTTPWDAELARLGRLLAGTRVVPSGSDDSEERHAAAARHLEAHTTTAAARSSFLVRHPEAADGDLIEQIARGHLPWEDVPVDALPAEARELKPDDRQQWLEDQRALRRGLRSEIAHLTSKRDAFLRNGEPDDSFAQQVLRAIREQPAAPGAAVR